MTTLTHSPIDVRSPGDQLAPDNPWIDSADCLRLLSSPARPATALASTPDRSGVPVIEDDCILCHGDRWVSLSDAQLPVARMLLAGRLVTWPSIHHLYRNATGRSTAAGARTMMYRIVARFESVGIEVLNVRGKGFRLAPANRR